MKRSAKGPKQQMNLPLLTGHDRAVVADLQQKELTLALVELLLDAAQKIFDAPSNGGDDDASETHA